MQSALPVHCIRKDMWLGVSYTSFQLELCGDYEGVAEKDI